MTKCNQEFSQPTFMDRTKVGHIVQKPEQSLSIIASTNQTSLNKGES